MQGKLYARDSSRYAFNDLKSLREIGRCVNAYS